ncbi:MAG: TfoX/Sxy family protein [Zoogloeaceae bacterium]|nr:TfoX/Sxy family protein [Rhodocyclaceae bacterium]MCP5236625.1 TfoX/Sxy family protein [Zoogloeaceae bacterium]
MGRSPRPEVVDHALELFAPLGSIRTKRMFGGHGFYCDGLFFALVAWDTVYLKADAQSRGDFERAGSRIFSSTRADGRTFSMGYWSAPEAALDSPQAMMPWARAAIACALRQRGTSAKGGRSRGRSSTP